MSSDDQQFLDVLASVPHDIAAYGSRVADYFDRYTNSVATDIRNAIDNSTWIPDRIKPPKSPSSNFFSRPTPPPKTLYEKTIVFLSTHSTPIAITLAFTSTTLYLIHLRKRSHLRKRRAKKLPNGARKEIVVLSVSTFHDPLTRSLALDLERRGYVVYVTVSSTEEDSLIQQEARADLRPLWMDVTSTVPNPTVDIHPNLEPIRELLQPLTKEASGRSSGGSSMGNMTIAGLVVFPGGSGYPSGSFPLLPPADVIDTLNTRLISPLLSIQQFLPLLLQHSSNSAPASVVIAYPSIPASLSPPNQIPESIITTSLSSLATSLRRELRSNAAAANITVHDLKLGNFDLGSISSTITQKPTPSSHSPTPRGSTHQYLHLDPVSSQLIHQPSHWHSSQRSQHLRTALTSPSSPLIRGSPARFLHNAVFDALAPPPQLFFRAFGRQWDLTTAKRGGTVFVGSGAKIYDWVGRWVPGGVVGFVMGMRTRKGEWKGLLDARRRQQEGLRQQGKEEEQSPSRGTSASPFADVGESAVWEKV